MDVPSGFGARLKHQQGLERIARSIHVQVDMFFVAVALRLRNDLQRGASDRARCPSPSGPVRAQPPTRRHAKPEQVPLPGVVCSLW